MDVTGYPIYLHVQTNVEANRYRPVMTILFIFGMFTRILDVIRVCFIPKAPFQSHFRMMLMSLLKSSPGRCDSWQDDVAITHLNFSPEYEKANGSKLLTFLVVQKRLLQVIQQQSSSNLSKFGIKGRIARCTNRNSFYASWFVLNIFKHICSHRVLTPKMVFGLFWSFKVGLWGGYSAMAQAWQPRLNLNQRVLTP